MATHLTVNINRQHLGKITLEESGERYALEYAQSWLVNCGSALEHLFYACLKHFGREQKFIQI